MIELLILFGLILLLLWGWMKSAEIKETQEFEDELLSKNQGTVYQDSKTIVINIPRENKEIKKVN